MGISISEIQDKTLLRYAQKIDDGDGELNKDEAVSLFNTIDHQRLDAQERELDYKEQKGVGDDIFQGVIGGLLATICFKSARNLKGFASYAAAFTAGSYLADKVQEFRFSRKADKFNAAYLELSQLINEESQNSNKPSTPADVQSETE